MFRAQGESFSLRLQGTHSTLRNRKNNVHTRFFFSEYSNAGMSWQTWLILDMYICFSNSASFNIKWKKIINKSNIVHCSIYICHTKRWKPHFATPFSFGICIFPFRHHVSSPITLPADLLASMNAIYLLLTFKSTPNSTKIIFAQ